MDKDANRKNTDLYNRHANQHATADEALKKREKGKSLPLKKFHNTVKRMLINRFAGGVDRLLDLACGRGGDLRKWIDSEVGYVKGYDIAEHEVEEARKRLIEHQTRQAEDKRHNLKVGHTIKADFQHSTDIGDRVWADADGPYDVVTCMFALHYFFTTQQSARNAIQLVAENLKEGGYFVGVLPNGKKVQETIGPAMKPRNLKMLRLCPKWVGNPRPFGSAYTCAIADTVTEGGDEGEGSYEYLVFQKVLVGLAREFDLHPVIDYDDFQLEELLEPAETSSDGTRLFRQFRPTFKESHMSLTTASRLNCAFVFRKGREEQPDLPQSRAPEAPDHGRAAHKRAREDDDKAGPRQDAATHAANGHDGGLEGASRAKKRTRAEFSDDEDEREPPPAPTRFATSEPTFKLPSRFKKRL